ncbi:MAG: hypothetical protein ABRQ39_26415 [Candidatus Eremiobacterota bacterium]
MEKICKRCNRPVSKGSEYYDIYEQMHWICFHLEYEHGEYDPDEPCSDPSCPWKHKMNFDREKIRKNIEISLQSSGNYKNNTCKDIAFHMTDWLNDLEELCRFYQNPEEYKSPEEILMKFLIHVPGHLAEAAKVLND